MENSVSDNEGMREGALREPDLSSQLDPRMATYAPGHSYLIRWSYDSVHPNSGEVDGRKFSSDGAHFGDGRSS